MIDQIRRSGAALLVLLCLANALNLSDRILLGVVQEPIKAEFGLSDFQLGLLGGPAFAVLYSLLGLPIARFAERSNRSLIVAGALALFSAMTAACGVAQSFFQLLLARLGVSVGEAGISPPALSLISERYRQERRGMAMSIFAIGGPIGALFATIGAGAIAQSHGWRASFLLFGGAGIILAAVIALLVPDRAQRVPAGQSVSFRHAAGFLFQRRTVVHICIASALTGASAMFISQYLVSFFMRVHGLSLAGAAAVMGAMAIFGIIGSFIAGYVSDVASRRWAGARPMVCAICFLLAAPAYALSFWVPMLPLALAALFFAAAVLNCYTGLSYASLSSVVPPTMRATVIAFFTIAANLIGYAFGPPLFGKLSDMIAASARAAAGLDAQLCASQPALSECVAASGTGLRWALSIACLLFLVAAFHFWRASRAMPEEIINEGPMAPDGHPSDQETTK